MGTLDQPTGTNTTRKIDIFDVSGKTPPQIEAAYNNNYGKKGWRIIQIIVLNSKPYIVCEKEITE